MNSREELLINRYEEHIRELRSEHLVDIVDVAAYAVVKAWSWVTIVLTPIGWIMRKKKKGRSLTQPHRGGALRVAFHSRDGLLNRSEGAADGFDIAAPDIVSPWQSRSVLG